MRILEGLWVGLMVGLMVVFGWVGIGRALEGTIGNLGICIDFLYLGRG